jgi:hypothetical protein
MTDLKFLKNRPLNTAVMTAKHRVSIPWNERLTFREYVAPIAVIDPVNGKIDALKMKKG